MSLTAVAVLAAVYVIGFYNRIVGALNLAKRAWSNVAGWQRKELRALELMAEKMGEYAAFERGALADITRLREAGERLDDNKIDVSALREAAGVSSRARAVLDARREAYPDLQTGKLYVSYMREVSECEAQVAAALTVFNRGVEEYNNTIQMFPNNLLNAAFFRRAKLDEFRDSKAESEFEYRPNF